MAGKETTISGRGLKIDPSKRDQNDADKCKIKFFKHRQSVKNSDCKSDLQELFMMQGTCTKWIDSSTKEIIVAYSLDNNALTVDNRPQQSSSSLSTENDKRKGKGPGGGYQLVILNSPQNSPRPTSPKVARITRMSGPRPQTIRKKMEMEMKLAEKCKRKCKKSETTATSLRSSKRTCLNRCKKLYI